MKNKTMACASPRSPTKKMSSKLIIGFYSTLAPKQHEARLQASWGELLAMYASLGETVKLGSFGLFSEAGGLKEYQSYNFSRKAKSAVRELNRGNLRHFSFCSVEQITDAAPAWDWDLIADCGCFSPMNLFVYQVGIDVGFAKQKIADIRVWLRQIFLAASKHTSPGYGHAFVMPSSFLPNGYSLGVMGNAPSFLLKDTNSWRRQCSAQVEQSVRNILPFNYLNAKHINGLRQNGLKVSIEKCLESDDELCQWIIDRENEDIWQALQWDNPHVVEVRKEAEKLRLLPWQSVFEE